MARVHWQQLRLLEAHNQHCCWCTSEASLVGQTSGMCSSSCCCFCGGEWECEESERHTEWCLYWNYCSVGHRMATVVAFEMKTMKTALLLSRAAARSIRKFVQDKKTQVFQRIY